MTRFEEQFAAQIRDSWSAVSDSYCDLGATFLLCEETGELAGNGACPTHGGDACLAIYGKVALLDPDRNPVIATALVACRNEGYEKAQRDVLAMFERTAW